MMQTVLRRTTLDIAPEDAWAYFEVPEHWPEWDPDMVAVAEDAEPGIASGQVWDIQMKKPKRARLVFSDVVPKERFTWQIVALGGAMKGGATFRFQSADHGRTAFEYEFGMSGLIGSVFWRVARDTATQGVDGGLANITRLLNRE